MSVGQQQQHLDCSHIKEIFEPIRTDFYVVIEKTYILISAGHLEA